MIKCSAIKIYPFESEYPIIITGFRHADCYEFLQLKLKDVLEQTKDITEGFLDEMDRFYDRYNAKYEALRCGQLFEDSEERALYSEDIWPE